MRFLKERLAESGGFNIVLILVALLFRCINLTNPSIFVKVDAVFSIIALIAGIVYWLKTYVKESAKYYKMFMILYALGALVSFASTFLDFKNIFNGDIVTTSCVVTLIIEAIIFICVTVLAFAKDLGKKKSLYLVVTIIGLNIISFFVSIIANPNYIIVSLSNLLLACVAGVFVAAKYNNKASRGSN